MKNVLLLILTLATILAFTGRGLAQTRHGDSVRLSADSARLHHDTAKLPDTTKSVAAGTAATQDDDMDMFLLFYGIAFVGIAFAAVWWAG